MNKNEGEIVIRIVETSEKSGNKPNSATVKREPSKKPSSKVQVKKDSDVETALKTSLIQHAVSRLENVIVTEVNYRLDKYYSLTDNYRGQQAKNIATGMIKRADTIGKSVLSGFAMGGPVGAIAMGIVEGLSLAQDIDHNFEQERLRIRQMDAQLSFNRQRAGFSLTAGVTGENK